jgi:hypothetical protein
VTRLIDLPQAKNLIKYDYPLIKNSELSTGKGAGPVIAVKIKIISANSRIWQKSQSSLYHL